MTSLTGLVSPLLLSLCLLLVGMPRVGLAAQDAPRSAPRLALSGPLADPEAPEATPSWEEPARARAPLGLRLLTEAGAGVVSAAILGGAGWFLGAASCLVLDIRTTGYYGCLTALGLGALLGFTGGYALGVWWGGELMGGDGRLLHAVLGATAGMVVALAVGALVVSQNSNLFGPVVLAIPVPILLGAHLGYELFQQPASPALEASRPSLQPVISLSARGAVFGLGGRF